jgi:O-antigen ligase
MMAGRTGYVIMFTLVSWFAWTTLSRYLSAKGRPVGRRHAAAVILLMAVAIFGAYSFSSRLQDRVDLAVSELSAWKPGVRSNTSVGDRMEFYYNALQISSQYPVAGVGTGGFHAAYEKQVQGKDLWVVHNPHNEYLLITVQTGLIGLSLLLYLFYTLWRNAPLLDSAFNQDAARGVVLATMADCLFNSPLLDHAPGLLFSLMIATFFAGLGADQKHD